MRNVLFAVGIATLSGAASCGGNVASSDATPQDSGAPDSFAAAGDSGRPFSAIDAAPSSDGEDGREGAALPDADGSFVCASRSGYFRCGEAVCSRAIQACFVVGTTFSCAWYGDGALPAACAHCPTCDCVIEALRQGSGIPQCQDDGAGGITFGVIVAELGQACTRNADCGSGLCENNGCTCLPAGAALTGAASAQQCCTSLNIPGAACPGGVDQTCIVQGGDCFGGTCAPVDGGAFGRCTCVGAHGSCSYDTDCCAGATKCVPAPTGGDECQ